jgi:biofilm protein TabA
MIIDQLSNSAKYKKLHPIFDKAFDFLSQSDFDHFENGKLEIEKDDLFAIVSRNGTSIAAEPKLEIHRKYLDIHYVIQGTELIGWKFLNICNKAVDEFKINEDYQLFDDKDFNTFKLHAGEIMIVYPNDAHAPLLQTANLFKLVLKIKI